LAEQKERVDIAGGESVSRAREALRLGRVSRRKADAREPDAKVDVIRARLDSLAIDRSASSARDARSSDRAYANAKSPSFGSRAKHLRWASRDSANFPASK
jgi:hypothetical protein